MSEFDLIERFFSAKTANAHPGVVLGIGDDCALLQPTSGQQLAVSSDMLVEGRHFLAGTEPATLGHKALAVNLSDLAAMGAEPLGFTLALALPPERAADSAWLDAFSHGLLALAAQHGCPLVGGDTTAGPLTICITVFGQVPAGQALRRSTAQAGDALWVSGSLGDARLALLAMQGKWALTSQQLTQVRTRLERPIPRLALGRALRGVAHAAIDLSDGLLGDLGHVLRASGVGACLQADALAGLQHNMPDGPLTQTLELVLSGGDDYELLFSAPPQAHAAVLAAARASATAVTPIGRIEAGSGLRVLDRQGQTLDTSAWRSFDHFSTPA